MRQVICNAVPDSSLVISIEGETYRHLAFSLRKKVGEHLKIRLETGELFEAEILEINREIIKCKLCYKIKEDLEFFPLFVLLQWELKGEKMDAVIRQSTEIGVTHIMPVLGDYSVPRAKSTKEKERRKKIITFAREQSGSPIDTRLFASFSLVECLGNLDVLLQGKKVCKLLAYEKKEVASKTVFSAISGDEEALVVCVGAEGGISEAEYSLLSKNAFCPVYFNTHILKAETASIYALSSLREAYSYKKGENLRG